MDSQRLVAIWHRVISVLELPLRMPLSSAAKLFVVIQRMFLKSMLESTTFVTILQESVLFRVARIETLLDHRSEILFATRPLRNGQLVPSHVFHVTLTVLHSVQTVVSVLTLNLSRSASNKQMVLSSVTCCAAIRPSQLLIRPSNT